MGWNWNNSLKKKPSKTKPKAVFPRAFLLNSFAFVSKLQQVMSSRPVCGVQSVPLGKPLILHYKTENI